MSAKKAVGLCNGGSSAVDSAVIEETSDGLALSEISRRRNLIKALVIICFLLRYAVL